MVLRSYNVIYDLVDDVRAAMEGRLVTVEERTELGQAEVGGPRLCGRSLLYARRFNLSCRVGPWVACLRFVRLIRAQWHESATL